MRKLSCAILLLVLAAVAACDSRSGTAPLLNDDEQRALNSLITDHFGSASEPGLAFLAMKDGEIIFERTVGVANIKSSEKITSSSNFRLASMTKQFTALAALMLSDRGQLDLDAPISVHFDALPVGIREVTPRMLIHHTSGLVDYASLGDLLSPERLERLTSGHEQLADSDVLDLVRMTDELYFSPGSRWRYSNTGYALLALLIEKASGTSFPEFLRQNIFEPLEMYGSAALSRDDVDLTNRVYGYSKTENGWTMTDQNFASTILGDGGIYSSLDDLRKWFDFLNGTRKLALSDVAFNEFSSAGTMFDGKPLVLPEPPLPTGSEASKPLLSADTYGYGLEIAEINGETIHFHGGATIGFSNMMVMNLDQRVLVLLLTNRNNIKREFVERAFSYFLD